MLEPLGFEGNGHRVLWLECEHGSVEITDVGPLWSEQELIAFARRHLSRRCHCTCATGQRVWLAPKAPAHVTLKIRVFATDEPDELETQRPAHIPGWAVSLAAWRGHTRTPGDDHPLAADDALVAWWKQMADTGQLPSEIPEPPLDPFPPHDDEQGDTSPLDE
jgi:hypothetical protein